MKRRHLTPEEDKAKGPKFLTHFRVERITTLIGDGEQGSPRIKNAYHVRAVGCLKISE